MLKNFIIRILSFSLVVSAILFGVFYFLLPQFYLPVFPFVILLFLVVTIAVHVVITKAGKRPVRQFSTFYMGSITAKLFIYMIFIVVYALLNKEQAAPFLITFFVLYVLFTFFETYSLLKDLRKQEVEK